MIDWKKEIEAFRLLFGCGYNGCSGRTDANFTALKKFIESLLQAQREVDAKIARNGDPYCDGPRGITEKISQDILNQ